MDRAPESRDPAPAPDRAAEDQQRLAAVVSAMQRLPREQREALALSVEGELRHEQIAAIAGCSVAAVKVQIHRARMQLRAELEAQEKAWRM